MKKLITLALILISFEVVDAQRIRFEIPLSWQQRVERFIVSNVNRITQDFVTSKSKKLLKDYHFKATLAKTKNNTVFDTKKTVYSDCDRAIFWRYKGCHELAKIYNDKYLKKPNSQNL